ncbi:hypothetical protein NX029_28530 [Cytobacillus firmus]|nr:hypothetical protein [Cytobacillus firmus]
MKGMRITPKKKAAFYFGLVAVLLFQHTLILSTDITAWFLFNFYIAGLIATVCVAKGIKQLKGEDKFNVDRENQNLGALKK